MNESCHIWMSHVTYEWVMWYMNESCHIWMSHVTVTYEWVMSHMNESCYIWMRHVFLSFFFGFRRPNLITGLSGGQAPDLPLWTQEPVPDRRTAAIPSLRHVSHINESLHLWMSHVTYERIMSLMHESFHISLPLTVIWIINHHTPSSDPSSGSYPEGMGTKTASENPNYILDDVQQTWFLVQFSSISFILKSDWGSDPLFEFRRPNSQFFCYNRVQPAEVNFFKKKSASAGWSQLFSAKVDFNRLESVFFASLFFAPKLQIRFVVPFWLQPAEVAKISLQPV